ncbi:MAG: aminomethyl-transferring glycine dehydrogenase subunit GcvPA, partial [Candidatus Omnitrophota bacterium]
MSYLPLTENDRRDMFETLGISSFEELVRSIPASLRGVKLDIPEGLSELELQALLERLGRKNLTTRDCLSFLGGGSYDHFIPAAVSQIISRNEFYTAYTPYQPEASQGTLQAIFEYQSFMTELTGLDVSNASHYDGATSLAEAALLALRQTDRATVLVARSVHPHYREVLNTYLKGTPFRAVEVATLADGRLDRADFESKLGPQTACAVVQSPNFFGVIEDLDGMSDRLHAAGSLLVMVCHPLALAVMKSPGEWGADLAVGEGQPLGIPMNYGGPYLGYFSAARSLIRRMPGRLAGMTLDSEGRRAFCLTLQAREQHIRRERAASNICTNQALCALAACVYMTLLGKEGVREAAEMNVDRAHTLREKIAGVKGFSVGTNLPVFNEFVVRSSKPFAEVDKKLR